MSWRHLCRSSSSSSSRCSRPWKTSSGRSSERPVFIQNRRQQLDQQVMQLKQFVLQRAGTQNRRYRPKHAKRKVQFWKNPHMRTVQPRSEVLEEIPMIHDRHHFV